MASTERLLHLLDLLQSRPVWTGPELAERLEVTTRSVRRDIERLRDLGYPVNATQGPGGGYQLGAGRGMPPLLLSDEEAVATAVALRLAATGTVSGASEPALRTLAKLDQVMPVRLREEVRALREATETLGGVAVQIDPDHLMTLARATRDRVRVRFDYRSRTDHESARRVEPVRLVATSHRWYLMAWDVDREDWRTFRLDRMTAVERTTWGFRHREHPDPVEYVHRAISRDAWTHQVRVRFHCSPEQLAARLPANAGTVGPDPGAPDEACVLETGAEDLQTFVGYLVMIGHDFDVLDPPALSTAVEAAQARMRRAHLPRAT